MLLFVCVHIRNTKCKYYHGLEKKHVVEEEGCVCEGNVSEPIA